MFELRFRTVFIILLLISGIMGATDYSSETDRLEMELAEAQTRVARTHEAASLRQQEWKDIQNARIQLAELMKRGEELLKQRDLLETKERKLTVEINYLAESLATTVEKTRSKAIGSVISELQLADRPTLHNAKIFKITQDSISFIHEDGAANLRATTEELPPELVQKYDLGSDTLVKRLQNLKEDLLAAGTSSE